MFPLILLPTDVNAIMQEKWYKKNMIGAFSSGGGKEILVLLVEVITFYVKPITIHIR